MFTISEICDLLDVSIETVRRWIRSGELKAQKSGKSYLVTRNDLREYLSKKHKPNSPLLKAVDEKNGTELVGVYLEMVNGISKEEEDEDNLPVENQKDIQKLYDLEEQILKYEIKVIQYKEEILSLRKESLEIKRKLL